MPTTNIQGPDDSQDPVPAQMPQASAGSTELARQSILSENIPAEWRSILADCSEFFELANDGHTHEPSTYVALHERIMSASEALLEPHTILDADQGLMRRSIACALHLVAHLKPTFSADRDYFDTAGSRTIYLYKNDFLNNSSNDADIALEDLNDYCTQQLGLSDELMGVVSHKVERRLQRVERTKAVVRAIREEFNLEKENPHVGSSIHSFFEALYPGTGITVEEVEILTTSTMIFFTLPFKEGEEELSTLRYSKLPEQEKQIISEFLKSLKVFTQEKFAHFPAFGFIDESKVDMAVVERIAKKAGVSSSDVLQEIKSCVTILPQSSIDKYVVHDVWGHSWQATLSGLGRMYHEVATYANPLSINESAAMLDESGTMISFRECFHGEGDDFHLDEDNLKTFYTAEVTERIPIAMTPVFAEMLADIIEYKFLEDNPGKEDLMESSSVFKFSPTKLDLIMKDLPFYYRQATKIFRLWTKSKKRQAATLEELCNLGASEEAAEKALKHAAQLFSDYEEQFFKAELGYTTEGNGLTTNVFGRVMLNFISMHAALTKTYNELDNVSTGELPLRTFKKLMAVSAAVFYEENPQKNFWRMDEFVALHFIPLCRELAGEKT